MCKGKGWDHIKWNKGKIFIEHKNSLSGQSSKCIRNLVKGLIWGHLRRLKKRILMFEVIRHIWLTVFVHKVFYAMNYIIMHDWFRVTIHNMLNELWCFVFRKALYSRKLICYGLNSLISSCSCFWHLPGC